MLKFSLQNSWSSFESLLLMWCERLLIYGNFKGCRYMVIFSCRKLYDNAIQEIISDTSKFEKLNEDPTLKREASLQRFLRKLKQKNFFNENEYDKLYPSGSAPAYIYGTPKMHKF